MKGVIRKSTGSWYEIYGEDTVWNARIKGKFRLEGKKNTNPVAVGDWVEFSAEGSEGDAVIEKLLPRKNYIVRKASNLSRQEHIIAANLDQVLILATLVLPRTSQGFIDRILATAEAYDIPAVIAFNKCDMYNEELEEMARQMCMIYEKAGYACVNISVKAEIHTGELYDKLKGKITLLTGHSGVGKSSLLNLYTPGLALKTGTISGFSLKGKHTTTFAEMHRLEPDTYLIDTPGIKEFGMVNMGPEEIKSYFPEIRSLLKECRFYNCIHINEPGCAVISAVESGEIDAGRYQSYLSMVQNIDTHR